MPVSGCKTLYKVKYWGWDGESRELDPYTLDTIDSELTVFVHSFWEDEFSIIKGLRELGIEAVEGKIASIEYANEDEIAAFDSGWASSHHKVNSSYGFEEEI